MTLKAFIMPDSKEDQPKPSAELPVAENDADLERLKANMNRSDMEKLHLFTQMLRRNAALKRAKITHK